MIVTLPDTTTNAVVGAPIIVGTGPAGVGVDPTINRAYVANQNSNNVTVIDTTPNAVVGTPISVAPAGSGHPHAPSGAHPRSPGRFCSSWATGS